ncbi:hypothetical protein B0H34DRAFT_656390 [Crassisporium funariophilum]|nr:hypothetical protein B0H34DRAFT_656390 [Crassisporium funariophilum]
MVHRFRLLAVALYITTVVAVKNPKRGLAFAEADNINDIKKANTSASVVSWQYDWAQTPPDYLAKSGIQYIPMQWGVNGIETFAAKVRAQKAKIILGFNEPDFDSQSNIDPVRAAALWKQYINPLADSGVRLGAPAVTNAPSGRPWLANFLAACNGCKIDFIPIHWYGQGIGNFYDYLWQVHYQFPNYPIWVTEYASTSTNDAEVLDFLTSTARYMDTLDWIGGYAWFAFFVSAF